MKKFKMSFDIEKEEQFLNEQLEKGYRCTSISGLGIYTFEKTDKAYVMRLDYQDYMPKKRREEYKGMYEDFGWNYVSGYWLGGVQYWQKENDGQNEIFSDCQSKRNYYRKLMGYSLGLSTICLVFSISNNRAGLYLTEGLWNISGSLFWKALLFETPFVLLRLIPFFMCVLFGISSYRAYRKYLTLKER